MERDLHGYRVNSGFPTGFSSFIESWFEVIYDYERKTRYDGERGDSIYWYNERANVGAFASALSRNNASVIEEYPCIKGRGADKGLGRADISFFYRNDWYLAEAKLHWKKLSPRSSISFDEKILNESLMDAKRSWHGDKGTIPLGLNFVVPSIHPSHKNSITNYVKSCIAQLEETNPCGFWAYCAPGRLRNLQSSKGEKNYFPMVIMLGEKCNM